MNALLLVCLLRALQAPTGLLESVDSYWESLRQGDKQGAAVHVSDRSLSNFQARREPRFRSWSLAGVQMTGSNEARVEVAVERWIDGGWFDWKVSESWRLVDGNWKVLLDDGASERRALFRQTVPPAPESTDVVVLPRRLEIHFLSRTQSAAVVVFNGSPEPVRVERIEFDSSLFKVQAPDDRTWVQPGERRSIAVHYVGGDERKEGESSLRVFVSDGQTERPFSIPVLYNHLSAGARALLGLTSEEARKLRRGDKLLPAVTVGIAPKPPERRD